ncbi:hypothetical protein JGU66_34230 [Myxococcaceae bacterium JPH2]|nr:hypothetical protein [Myxococcaceae bacterium JPH2]
MTATELTQIIDLYLAAWNELNLDRRATVIAQVWDKEGRLIDPPLASSGHAGISEHISALHSQFPGHAFRRASGIDSHNGFVRFAWELMTPQGTVAMTGMDVGELTPEGKLRRVTGFFGPLPELTKA